MIDYDFSSLNDKEFENLAIDLISLEANKRFERFKAGKDGGIDGRYYKDDGRQEIIQCKHYLKSGYSSLMSSLKNKNKGKNEADKVKLLNPEKYIFITSLPLSALNKKEIKEIFTPYIKKDSDIYGQEDLNDLLKKYPEIEEKYYKLWISSTTVLKRIFNNAIKGRSDFLFQDIKEKIKYYVITENHNKAIKKLESSHTVIITGEPGIGKTTLAKQLALNYIEQDFEFCVISKDINEAESILRKDKKQLFYFDDFLGSNFLEALEPHADSQIVQFIQRVKKDKTKRFILTSRTNILNRGIGLSDKFKTEKLDKDEFIITVDSLTEFEKAKILYNHIWHSNLPEEYIDEIYQNKRYRKIINHKNFNPRLIEFITDIDRIQLHSAENYWTYIQSNLENPTEIWANTFDNQSNDFVRNIVLLVVFNGNSIEENELQKAYYKLNKLMGLTNNSHSSIEFENIIKDTVRYFLNRSIDFYTGKPKYKLFNPSIADFILNRYKNNNAILINLFNSLLSEQSLKILENNTLIDKETRYTILQSIKYETATNPNYLLKLAYLYYTYVDDIDNISNIINFILSQKEHFVLKKIITFIELLEHLICHNKLTITTNIIKKILNAIDIEEISQYDFEYIINFCESHNFFDYPNLVNLLSKKIEDYLINSEDIPTYIQDETISKIEDIIYKDIKEQTKNYINEFNDNVFYTLKNKNLVANIIDKEKIENKIKNNIIENCKDTLSFDIFNKKIDINNNSISSKIEKEISNSSNTDEIDDLFERQ
jgi:DNA polymerase III delta prime subunit